MSNGEAGGNIPGFSAADVLKWQEEDKNRRARRPKKGTVIHEHVDLDAADREAKARRRKLPYGNNPDGLVSLTMHAPPPKGPEMAAEAAED